MKPTTYTYKLYPSRRNKHLHQLLEAARQTYNHCIKLYRRYYRLYHEKLPKQKLQRQLTKQQKLPHYAYLRQLPSSIRNAIPYKIEKAYQSYFSILGKNKRAAPPCCRSQEAFTTITLYQSGWKLDEEHHRIRIGKTWYKYFRDRALPSKPKSVTLKRSPLGDFYLYFTCQIPKQFIPFRKRKVIGLDYSMQDFLCGSDGNRISEPQFLRESLAAIQKAADFLAHKHSGSNNYQRAKKDLLRKYEKLKNQRSDFQWKLARKLVQDYTVVAIESLDSQKLQKKFGHRIADYALADFIKKLKYKAEETNTLIFEHHPYFASSQTCSNCGHRNPQVKNMQVKTWICPHCGAEHDRDTNAAINLAQHAMEILLRGGKQRMRTTSEQK